MMKETAHRRLMEDELAGQLKKAGIDAIPAYTVIPVDRPEKEVIASKVKELGADALFLTRLLDRKTVREYVPGTPYQPPLSYLDWYGYYGGYYSAYAPVYPSPYPPGIPPAYSPGYTVENVYDIAEANLYDAATAKLVWSAVTESRIEGNDQRAIRSYASQIMKSLREKKMIPD